MDSEKTKIIGNDGYVPLQTKDPIGRLMELFDRKLFNRASYELKGLLDNDRAKYLPLVKKKFEEYAGLSAYEEALSIGVVIIGIEKNNGHLANQLGNFARRLGDTRQSISLYQRAIKSTNSGDYPIYNLGATLARVDYYDNQALSAVNQYGPSQKFVLPYYLEYLKEKNQIKPYPEFFKQVKKEIEEFKKKRIEELMQEMEVKLGALNPETFVAKELQKKMTGLKASEKEILQEDNINYFIDLRKKHRGTLGEVAALYNLCLLSLEENNLANAQKYLGLIPENAKLLYLPLLQSICLHLKGESEKAYDLLMDKLAKDQYDRLYNLNLGLVCRKLEKKILAAKFLILGSYLVSLSEGILEREVFIERGHEHFAKSRLAAAKKIYEIVIEEKTKNELVFFNYAQILIKQDLHSRASQFLHKVVKKQGVLSNIAHLKIEETYAELFNRADQAFLKKKYREAVHYYKQAMFYIKNSEVIKKILETFQFFELGQSEKEIKRKLRAELEIILEEEKQEKIFKDNEDKGREIENRRRKLVEAGRFNIMQKKYYNAIPPLEEAFRIRPEKNLFSQLASLYKALKQNDKLVDLAMQYKRHQEYEHKQKLKKQAQKESNS